MANSNYQKHEEKLWKEACGRYQNLSKEEKNKKQKKAQERYQNLTEEQYHREHNKNLSEEWKKVSWVRRQKK